MNQMQSILETDKEQLQERLREAENGSQAADIMEKELDRILYRYNETQNDAGLQIYAAGMASAVRMMIRAADTAGEVKIWQDTSKRPDAPMQGKTPAFWVSVCSGLAVLALVWLTALGILAGPVSAAAATALFCVFAFGAFRYGRTCGQAEKAGYDSRYVKTEVRPDAAGIYQALLSSVMVMDRNLTESTRSSRLTADNDRKGSGHERFTAEELDVFAGLLEAAYSRDGSYALAKTEEIGYYLHRCGIEAVDYTPENAGWFEFMPSVEPMTIRPALATGGRLLRKGLAGAGST